MRSRLIALVTCLVICFPLGAMTFDEAMKPMLTLTYSSDGYYTKSGKLSGGGLGCSAFATAVYFRMQMGDAWTTESVGATPAWTAYQLSGSKFAALVALPKACDIPTADIEPMYVKALIAKKTLTVGQRYFFTVEGDVEMMIEGKKESKWNGHVGFVQPLTNGTFQQWHFSSLNTDGLATGDFATWLHASMYHRHAVKPLVVQLFSLP